MAQDKPSQRASRGGKHAVTRSRKPPQGSGAKRASGSAETWAAAKPTKRSASAGKSGATTRASGSKTRSGTTGRATAAGIVRPPARAGGTRTTGPATKPGTAKPGAKGNGRAAKPKKRGFFRRYWWVFVATPLVLILAVVGTLMYAYAHIEIPPAPKAPQTTFIYDRFGAKIAELHGEFNRTPIQLRDMPEVLQNAVLDVEDKDYYHHGGISVTGIIRAAWQDLLHRSAVQGGSTITQQYVKNIYTGDEKSIFRKVKEAMLAIKLEHKYTKQQILQKYLNTIYWGHGAYGVEAASQTYFGHHASSDNALESATLAAMIASPGAFDPINNPDANVARRNVVLGLMVQQGHLDEAEAERLQAIDKPPLHLGDQSEHGPYAYFLDYTRKWLLDHPKFAGEENTYAGGLRVYTTLDKRMQQAAETSVADHLPAKTDPSAALVAIDPQTGEIRAMVGGPDPNELTNKQNLAVSPSRRQVGSAFKPFTLAAAMEQGYSLNSYWSGPAEITLDDPRCTTKDPETGIEGPWTLSNAADEESGTFALADATAFSVNTVFAQLELALENGPRTWSARRRRSASRPICRRSARSRSAPRSSHRSR